MFASFLYIGLELLKQYCTLTIEVWLKLYENFDNRYLQPKFLKSHLYPTWSFFG